MEKKSRDGKIIKKEAFSLFGHLLDVSGDRGYRKFIFFLIMIDLTWFGSVVMDNLFGLSLGDYGEFAWTFLFGLGLVVVSDLKRVKKMGQEGFKSENFASLTTLIIGSLAIVTAILSLPFINVVSPTLNSIKGILALIAIVYVVLETWIIKSH